MKSLCHYTTILFLIPFLITRFGFCAHQKELVFPPVTELIKKPQRALAEIESDFSDFCTWSRRKLEIQQSTRSKKFENTFLLQEECFNVFQTPKRLIFQKECSTQECILSRFCNPSYRDAFEEKISQQLLQSLEKNENKAHYATFGSGDRFSDLVILAKVLSKNPKANVGIHFIDPGYRSYKALKGIVSTTPLEIVHLSDIEKKINSDNSAELFCTHKGFQEFFSYLTHYFPESVITGYVYHRVQDYLKLVKKKKLPAADVIGGSDLGIPPTQVAGWSKEQMEYDYALLCERTLINNVHSKNTRLMNNHTYGVILSFLQLGPSSYLKHFTNDAGNTLDLKMLYTRITKTI